PQLVDYPASDRKRRAVSRLPEEPLTYCSDPTWPRWNKWERAASDISPEKPAEHPAEGCGPRRTGRLRTAPREEARSTAETEPVAHPQWANLPRRPPPRRKPRQPTPFRALERGIPARP